MQNSSSISKTNGTGLGAADPPSRARRLTRRVPGTGRVWILLGLITLLVISDMGTGFDLAVNLAYALIMVIGVSFVWSHWGMDRLSASVNRPRRELSVGETFRETVALENRGGPPKTWVEVEDETTIPGLTIGEVVSLPGLITFRRLTIAAKVTQRGEFSLGPLVIRSSDPFALFPQRRLFTEQTNVLVYPRIVEIPDYASPSALISSDSSRRRRAYILSPEIASVRDYSPGDSVSRIHWPSTARAGKLMVKTFDQGRASELWVVFDQHRDAQAGEGEQSTDEYGATVAASTAHKYLGMQLPVGYTAVGSESLLLPPERGSDQRSQILSHIARSRPTGDRPLFDVLAELDRSVERGSSLVAITAAPDGDWVGALLAMRRRGVQTVAVLFERDSFDDFLDGDEAGGPSPKERLAAEGVRTYVVRRGASISGALSEPLDARHASIHASIGSEAAD